MQEIPMLAADLIERLDKQFPHRCPKPMDGERFTWMYAGKRELVDMLLSALESTNQEGEESNNVRIYT